MKIKAYLCTPKEKICRRDVAQLVAHYVRDVGVACSSHVIPTQEKPIASGSGGLVICSNTSCESFRANTIDKKSTSHHYLCLRVSEHQFSATQTGHVRWCVDSPTKSPTFVCQ